MCDNAIVQKQFEELNQFISDLSDKKANLIAVLHKAQEIFGYLPKEVQFYIAEQLDIPCSKVYGVVSFYSFFTMEPKGKHVVSICMGTACYVRGSDKVLNELEKQLKIQAGETTADGMFSIDALRCVGACGLAPVVIVDGKVFGRVNPSDVSTILEQYREGGEKESDELKVS